MHKPSAQITFIHQESVDYALLVLRETTRQLFLLDVPFSQILKTLGEVNEPEHSDVHATPRVPNRKCQARWDELYGDQLQFASTNLADAGFQLLGLGMPLGDVHDFLESCLTSVCHSCQGAGHAEPERPAPPLKSRIEVSPISLVS
jgi:hypothetical protein